MAARLASACLVALAIGSSFAGCSGKTPTGPQDIQDVQPAALTPLASSGDWDTSSPQAENFNLAPLMELHGRLRAGAEGVIDSLLIVRRGRLVAEEYYQGMTADSVHTMQSVSKSVASILTGIAIDQGRLALDTGVTSLFPDYAPVANPSPLKDAVTVRDLLMMRGGWDWSEATYAGSPLNQLNTCGCDWIRFMLDWRMREAPGSRWEYVSGGVILLGGAVERAVNQDLYLYARERLWNALGTEGNYWYVGTPDWVHTGGGLNMRPRDIAKVGQLVLDGGRWRGQQLVSESWIRESTAARTMAVRSFGSHIADYGYLWWRFRDQDVIAALGAQGQMVFISPGTGVVAVFTGRNTVNEMRPIDLFYQYILAAAR
jgi:CubicO group peptidase (beta-lactamase class C family)